MTTTIRERLARAPWFVLFMVACLGAGFVPVSTQDRSLSIPLPVTPRTRPANGHLFDGPSIILRVRIHERTEVERTDMDGESLPGAEKRAPYWTSHTASVREVIRVNERNVDDPNLKDAYLSIEQMDRGEHPLRFEFARDYIVFLKPSPTLIGNWNPARSDVDHIPPYAFAIPQGGFEFVGGKARPLVKGGPLDKYDGMPKEKLLEEIRRH